MDARRTRLGLALSALLTACTFSQAETARTVPAAPQAADSPGAAPAAAPVPDPTEFERFIATQPSPAELRTRYPGLLVVLPGDLATKELRLNRSRYFAQLDEQGRIVGGQFK